MRKFIYLTILVLVIVGCSNEEKLPSTFSDQDIDIGMEVQEVFDEGLILHIENKGTSTVGYGHDYSIEEFKGGRWVELPFLEELAFVQSLVLLPPDDSHHAKIPFEAELQSEKRYRVIKTFRLDDYPEELPLAAEFSVEKHTK